MTNTNTKDWNLMREDTIKNTTHKISSTGCLSLDSKPVNPALQLFPQLL